jgi:ribonuclease Z
MRPSLLPRLVNGPFEDPALFIRFLFENRALLFDLGDINNLSTRDVLKISHVFVSHAHMDHFIGFDRLLRIFLGRDKKLHMFGPSGIIKNVAGKLSGYQWNLVEQFTYSFSIEVTEIRNEVIKSCTFHCQDRFEPHPHQSDRAFSACVLKEPAFSVHVAVLDHRIPCLALSLQETFHINIKKDALMALDLSPGPWIQIFKQAVYRNLPSDTPIDIPRNGGTQKYPLGALSQKIATISPGQKIAYITDIAFSSENINKIRKLATGCDHLYIEAAFLDQDRSIAQAKYHLTAHQAGYIAAMLTAKKVTPFHFSPRYIDRAEQVEKETIDAFNQTIKKE